MGVRVLGRWFGRALAAAAPLALILTGAPGNPAQGQVPTVVSLKSFIDVETWQLDITWSAKDAFEDATWSAKLDMTATARYILKRGDKQDAWGRWHVESPQSGNMAFTAFLINKPSHSRDSYQGTGAPKPTGAATFDVGRGTPGYRLACLGVFPVRGNTAGLGTFESRVALNTMDMFKGANGICTGPLPSAGQTIHGSLTIPLPIAPFVPPLPYSRVGIQYVLQPLANLAPLLPPGKR